MKQLLFLITICSCIFACSDDDNNGGGFSQEELSPVVMFTYNNKYVEISNTNSGLWTSGKALNEKGEEIQGKLTKGFGSVSGNGRHHVTIVISKWISDDEIDYAMPNLFFDVVKPETFKSVFNAGGRLYATNAYPVNTTNEVSIEYVDDNATYWRSWYQGNFYSTPSYKTLQPSSSFKIIRSMLMGTDSVFIEAKFKARLYRNTTEYLEINDGYFKGFYYRKPR